MSFEVSSVSSIEKWYGYLSQSVRIIIGETALLKFTHCDHSVVFVYYYAIPINTLPKSVGCVDKELRGLGSDAVHTFDYILWITVIKGPCLSWRVIFLGTTNGHIGTTLIHDRLIRRYNKSKLFAVLLIYVLLLMCLLYFVDCMHEMQSLSYITFLKLAQARVICSPLSTWWWNKYLHLIVYYHQMNVNKHKLGLS